MKKMLLLAAALFAAPVTAQTLPLNQSTTFQTKADKVSPTFSGTATFTGTANFQGLTTFTQPASFAQKVSFLTSMTSDFYAAYGSGPYINFANGSLFTLKSGQFEFYLNGTSTPKFSIAPGQATFATPLAAATKISLTGGLTSEAYFGLNAGRPVLVFDGLSSRIEFDASGNYVFYQGGKKIASLDGNGTLRLRGSVVPNLGTGCC